MLSRELLFGFWRIPMWGYYWEYTIAQIELLALDAPVISFKSKTRRDKPQPISVQEIKEKVSEWETKYKDDDAKVEFSFDDYGIS